jgi:hypothetical protein
MYGNTPGQQAQEQYALAQMEASADQSKKQFETGTQGLKDKGILGGFIDDLQERGAKALAKLNSKKKKTGFGRLIGGLLGTAVALANPALGLAARAALPAAGSLVGGAAAGGFKRIKANLPDRVRDDMIFLKSKEKDAYQQLEEFESALKFEDASFEQTQVLQSGGQFITNLGTMAVLDNLQVDVPVGDTIEKVNLKDVQQIVTDAGGEYKGMDYIRDVVNLSTGGRGTEDTLGALSDAITKSAATSTAVPVAADPIAEAAKLGREVPGIGLTDVPTEDLQMVFDEVPNGIANLTAEQRNEALRVLQEKGGSRNLFEDGLIRVLSFDQRNPFNNIPGYFNDSSDMFINEYNTVKDLYRSASDALNIESYYSGLYSGN